MSSMNHYGAFMSFNLISLDFQCEHYAYDLLCGQQKTKSHRDFE